MLNPIKKIFGRGELDCTDVRKASSAYLEDDLTPGKMAAIQSHLSQCGPCRAFVDTLSSTIGMLARIPRVVPPSSFKQSILERTSRKDQGKS